MDSGSPTVVLLRGVNIGPHNRISMEALREALEEAGAPGARTYLQSGNVVLPADVRGDPAQLVANVVRERLGLEIGTVSRTRAELQAVVAEDPFGPLVSEPKRFQVTFLDRAVPEEAEERLRALAAGTERLHLAAGAIYSWHPEGVGRSKLASALARLGTGGRDPYVATARNWTTVTALLAMLGG